MRRLVAVLAAAILLPACAGDDTADVAQRAARKVERAQELFHQEGGRSAIAELEDALELYRRAGDRRGEAVALGHLGIVRHRLGEAAALGWLERSLAMKRELGDRLEEAKTLNALGLVHWSRADYRAAVAHLESSLEISRELGASKLHAAVVNNLGLVAGERGDDRRSLELFEQALALARDAGETRVESSALGNVGGVYLSLGRYRDAVETCREALAFSVEHGLEHETALDLVNLGRAHLGLGEIGEALAPLERALRLARRLEARKVEADVLRALGSLDRRRGRYENAMERYRSALELYESTGHRREAAAARIEIGGVELTWADLGAAERSFRQALDGARAIGHPRGVAEGHLALGGLELRRQRGSVAASHYLEARRLARTTGDRVLEADAVLRLALLYRRGPRHPEALAEATRARDLARDAGARLTQARALLAMGEIERRQDRLEAALEVYRQLSELDRDGDGPEIAWRSAYGRGRALEALGRSDEAIAAYEQAVDVVEGVRRGLRRSYLRAGYLDRRRQCYVELSRALVERGRFADGLLAAEKLRARSFHDLLASARTGADDGVRERLGSVDLERLRASLPAHTGVVEYVVGEREVLVFVLTRRQLRARVLPIDPPALRSKVVLFRDLLARRRGEDWRRPSASLYSALFAPVRGWLAEVERLVLIRSGILHYLPFAALSRPDGEAPRFLVEDYVLLHRMALGASRRLDAGTGRLPPTVLAVAPRRPRLGQTEPEARDVAALFPRSSRLLVGRRATESRFKSAAGRYRILHLATHAEFHPAEPLLSSLELEADASNDGRLLVREILGLRLDADLVVLSACETALGSGYFADLPAGDDFVGLTRAFLHAGGRTVLASLWRVDDASTARLMADFYRRYRTVEAPAALAEAQRAMLRAGEQRHPCFWAPFVLVGE